MKQFVKTYLFPGGEKARTIRVGAARGLQFVIDPREKSQRLLGLDEQELSKPLARFINRAATFIDIGASDGYYTIIAAKRNPALLAIGCEPSPELGDRCREHLRLNDLDGSHRIRWFPELVGTQHRTLDSLTEKVSGPILVKIDVEGAEADVLDSGTQTVARPDTMFVIETHGADCEEGCRQRLESSGYRCEVIDKAWWRRFLPETRLIDHNRWLIAQR